MALFPEPATDYHGHSLHTFTVDGCAAKVVVPKTPRADKAWVWKAEFFEAFPAFELAMLDRGFHLAFLDVGNTFGAPRALAHWGPFYRLLVREHGFLPRAILLGLSRGGLYCYNWAAENAEKVSCLYADNAVCDFKSWPAGRGASPGSPPDWEKLIRDYGFLNEQDALAYPLNPVDNLDALAQAGIPLVHATATEDATVPAEENTDLVEARYRARGGPIRVFRHPGGHHPHGLDDPTPLVEHILAVGLGLRG